MDENTPLRICEKCLEQYNQLNDMVKEKRKRKYDKLKGAQAFRKKLFSSFREDITDKRDDMHSVQKSSSPSVLSRELNMSRTPQKVNDPFRLVPSKFEKNEKEKELDDFSNMSQTSQDLEEEGKIEERANQEDQAEGDKISKLISQNNVEQEEKDKQDSPCLSRARSERIMNKSIRKEIEDYLYNTHIDEYNRHQEINDWKPKKRDFFNDLDRLVDFHVHEIVDHIFEKKELSTIFRNQNKFFTEKDWRDRFIEYATKAIRLVKPSERLMEDTMDINDYVSISLIDHEDDSKCKYINGCVIMNNIADRRMRSEIKNPKILLIGNSIGFTQEDA